MATPAGPKVPSQANRQQLDDLDALLQRMLALPVNRLDETEQAPPPPTGRTATPLAAPELPAELSWGERMAELDSAAATVKNLMPSLPSISEHLPHSDSTPIVRSVVFVPAVEPQPSSIGEPIPAPAEVATETAVTTPRGTRVPFWLMPLVWSNDRFDESVEPWGFVGRWLSNPSGRAFLGGLGFLLLAGAAALALWDWIGWTR
jgi:hypothetical protein